MRWRRTKLCWHYGGSTDPLDVDEDFVRVAGEVRYVETTYGYWRDEDDEPQVLYHWTPAARRVYHQAEAETVDVITWGEWAGYAVELVEPAPWFWWWDWVLWCWFKVRGRLD